MRERQKGRTQEQAAVSANVRSRKTVAKYEKLGRLPSELKQAHRHRTRPDPFAEDWSTVEKMLEEAPGLEAKAVFEWLCEQHPGRYRPGKALEVVINGRDNGVEVEGVYCERCGTEMELKRYLPWTVHGLEGDSKLERAYYVCPGCNGQTIFPPGQETGTAEGSLE